MISRTGSATEEEINKIAEMMLTKNFTSKQIAEAVSRTRNSVMGIIWRTPRLKEIGLPNLPVKGMNGKKAETEVKPKPVLKYKPVIIKEEPEMEGITLVRLKEFHCKFPMWAHHEQPGDKGLFCGEAKLPNSVYCDKHHKLCVNVPFVKPTRKRAA